MVEQTIAGFEQVNGAGSWQKVFNQTTEGFLNPINWFKKHQLFEVIVRPNNVGSVDDNPENAAHDVIDALTTKINANNQCLEIVQASVDINNNYNQYLTESPKYKVGILTVIQDEAKYSSVTWNLMMSLSNEQLKMAGLPYTKEEMYRMSQGREGGMPFWFAIIPFIPYIIAAILAIIIVVGLIYFASIVSAVKDVLISPMGQLVLAGAGIALIGWAISKFWVKKKGDSGHQFFVIGGSPKRVTRKKKKR